MYLHRVLFQTLIVASGLVLSGCDAATLGTSTQLTPSAVPDFNELPEQPEAIIEQPIIWTVQKDAGLISRDVRGRRGAMRTVLEDGSSNISVDPQTADGPYIAFSIEGEALAQLSGRELVVEVDAGGNTILEVQYHTLTHGGSGRAQVQLQPEISTHRVVLTPPVEPEPREADELRIWAVSGDSNYRLTGLRIGVSE